MVDTVLTLTNTQLMMNSTVDGRWRVVFQEQADQAVRQCDGHVWKAVESLLTVAKDDQSPAVAHLRSACSASVLQAPANMDASELSSALHTDHGPPTASTDSDSEETDLLDRSDLECLDLNMLYESDSVAVSAHNPFEWAQSHFQCPLCIEKFCKKEMFTFLICSHDVCNACAIKYFQFGIYNRQSALIGCAVCHRPSADDLKDRDTDELFRFMLQAQLESLLPKKDFELFDLKLRDSLLNDQKEFRWCTNCKTGYFLPESSQSSSSSNSRNGNSCQCDNCGFETCVKCALPWADTHTDLTCENYEKLMLNHPMQNFTISSAEQTSWDAEIIGCPKCKYKFELVQGGCMHLTCTNCNFQFCECCKAEFKVGTVSHD
jgi:hypothetical protein